MSARRRCSSTTNLGGLPPQILLGHKRFAILGPSWSNQRRRRPAGIESRVGVRSQAGSRGIARPRRRVGAIMGFRISTETRGERTVHRLHDDATGASASVLPSSGFNLFDLRLPLAGEVRPVLVAAEDFAENPRPGAGNGTPILFPYPNRVRDASFTFQGSDVLITGEQRPECHPRLRRRCPLGRGRARGRRELRVHRRALPDLSRNPEDAAALANRRRPPGPLRPGRPAADHDHHGLEPHRGRPPLRFRNPSVFPAAIRPAGHLDRTRVIVPAGRYWVLEDFLPTGEIRPVETGSISARASR